MEIKDIIWKLKLKYWHFQLYWGYRKIKAQRKKYCNKGYHHIKHCYAYFGENCNYFDFGYIMKDWDRKKGKIIQYLKCKDCNCLMFANKKEMFKYQILHKLPTLPKSSIPLSERKAPYNSDNI